MKAQPLLLACACIAALLAGSAAGAAPATLSSADQGEIAVSYQYLPTAFYQRVSPQVVLDSVRSDLLATLRRAGVASATLPALHANGLAGANVHAIDTEVERAVSEAGHHSSAHLLSYAAIDGIMRSVNDRYTVFLDPREYAALNQDLDGTDFGGVGIVIQQNDQSHYISVSNVIPDGPADKAGIQQDDVIVTIDGISTKNMEPLQASRHLRGQQGTTVSLGIERLGKPLSAPIVITRALIHDVSVFEKMLPNRIGYVELTVFGQSTGAELTSAIDRLQQEGVRAIVLDLRHNGGGRRARLQRDDVGGRRHRDLPAASARSPCQRSHGLGLGDHLRCDSGQRRRRDHRNPDLRQGRRPDDLPARRRFRGQDHDRALSHAAQPRYQPSRHRA